MSTSAFSTGLSGLNSYQNAMNVSAHNVANALTRGFKPQEAQFSESSSAGSGSTVSVRQGQSGAGSLSLGSGTDLNTEMVNQLQYRNGYTASAKAVKVANQMLGTLINTRA
ncbi:flagellar basal body protein [Burkholderiaceae bacterium DAT-1]|nr:flagellar basal body protein [Burkholderiaceae bacterium DAT-1]